MAVFSEIIKLKTEPDKLYDITMQIENAVRDSEIDTGTCTVFCPGSTAALIINEADPMLFQDIKNALERIILLGITSLTFIISVLLFVARKRFFVSMNYILFPAALIFIYFSYASVNVLHLFILFVILAICIDYGIYLSGNDTKDTRKAIVFSAFSSFAGFGVLIFSATNSLFSIGMVSTLGIIAILILIFFEKVKNVS